jgi:putative aldouronate transport system permease protein
LNTETAIKETSHRRVIPKNSFTKRFMRSKFLLLLLLPTLLYYFIFKYLPMFGLIVAFKDYKVFIGIWDSAWVGFKYFNNFFENPVALTIVKNTFLLGFWKLFWGFPAPILLALSLNEVRKVAFKRFVQTVSYLPHFISTVVVVGMIFMFLSPSTGLINDLLKALGFDPIAFLQSPGWFRTVYVGSEVWQDIGWGSIIYLAALTTVDPALYEASDIDGASRWQQTWHISLPGITPAIVILLIMNIGRLLETGFEKVYLLLTPATRDVGEIISTYVYRIGIVGGSFSYGAAIDFFMAIISFIFVWSANSISRKLNETSLW